MPVQIPAPRSGLPAHRVLPRDQRNSVIPTTNEPTACVEGGEVAVGQQRTRHWRMWAWRQQTPVTWPAQPLPTHLDSLPPTQRPAAVEDAHNSGPSRPGLSSHLGFRRNPLSLPSPQTLLSRHPLGPSPIIIPLVSAPTPLIPLVFRHQLRHPWSPPAQSSLLAPAVAVDHSGPQIWGLRVSGWIYPS